MATSDRNDPPERPRKRHVVRPEELAAILRREIVGGQLAPGSLLPVREVLRRRFAASNTTVQRAIELLRADGFITARRRAGTRVVDRPPHVDRIALVFNDHPGGRRSWNGFHERLLTVAAGGGAGREVHPYFDVLPRAEDPNFVRLLADECRGTLAGAVFVAHVDHYAELLPRLAGLPCVSIAHTRFRTQVPLVDPDRDRFSALAVRRLRDDGCRRPGFVIPTLLGEDSRHEADHLQQLVEHLEMSADPVLIQECQAAAPRSTEMLVRLLLRLPSEQRPDALVISDDNLVPAATRGLIAAGASGLPVIAHANWPDPVPSAVPALRLGFDAAEVLHACLAVIDAQRAGHRSPERTVVLPRFEPWAEEPRR